MKSNSRVLSNALDLFLLLAAVVLFYPQVGRPGWISPGGDMLNLMLPARDWASRWLGQGIIPLWNPETFGGVPFLGAMQAAVLYPPNLVLGAFLSPLTTINLLRLCHIYLFGALTWIFLRFERGCARPAALLGAVAVAGSAHVSSHMDHINQLAAMAWLPALVACQWRYHRTSDPRWLLLFAAVLAVQVFAGHPQAVFYSLLLAAAVAAAWFVKGPPQSRKPRVEARPTAKANVLSRRLIPVAFVGAAVAGGLVLASIQLVPTAETARYSRRSMDGLDYPLWGSMPRRFILALIEPRAFGDPLSGYTDRQFGSECGSFVGRTTLLLAVIAIVASAARRRFYPIFWALVVAAAFVLALGGYGPFASAGLPSPLFLAYLKILPPARHLRVPPRILLLATFGLAVLGAEGLNLAWRLKWWEARPSRRYIRAIGAWGALAVAVFELWSFQRMEFHNRVVRYHGPKMFLAGEASEVLKPLLGGAAPESPLPDFRVFRLMVNDPDYLIDWRPEAVRNRFIRLQPNLGMLLGVAEVEGYEEGLLPPVRYFDFLNYFNRNLRNPDPDAVLLGLMNVRYLYVDYNLKVRSKVWRPIGEVSEPATGRRYALYENPLWLPRVAWADQLPQGVALSELRGMLSRGRGLSPRMRRKQSYGPREGSSLKTGSPVNTKPLEAPKVRQVGPNRMIVENRSRRGGKLLIAQNPYPGWIVKAKGREIAVEPATDFSGAALVPEGAETLEIAYRPFSFRIGAYGSLMALAAWIAAAISILGRKSGQTVVSREADEEKEPL